MRKQFFHTLRHFLALSISRDRRLERSLLQPSAFVSSVDTSVGSTKRPSRSHPGGWWDVPGRPILPTSGSPDIETPSTHSGPSWQPSPGPFHVSWEDVLPQTSLVQTNTSSCRRFSLRSVSAVPVVTLTVNWTGHLLMPKETISSYYNSSTAA